MIDTAHQLPVTRQAELLDISRSNVYYLPRRASQADLALMRRIDELHLNYPFCRFPDVARHARAEGLCNRTPACAPR